MSFYKVVAKNFAVNDTLEFISFSTKDRGGLSLTYALGKTTKAPENTLGIFVFDTLERALDYLKGCPDFFYILEGEGIVITPLKRFVFGDEVYIFNNPTVIYYESYLPLNCANIMKGYYKKIPEGTVLLSEFTPRIIAGPKKDTQ